MYGSFFYILDVFPLERIDQVMPSASFDTLKAFSDL